MKRVVLIIAPPPQYVRVSGYVAASSPASPSALGGACPPTPEHATAAYCHFAVKRAKARLALPDDRHRELTEEQEALLEAERRAAAEQVASARGTTLAL